MIFFTILNACFFHLEQNPNLSEEELNFKNSHDVVKFSTVFIGSINDELEF